MSHRCRFALSNKPIGALLLDSRIKLRVRMLEHMHFDEGGAERHTQHQGQGAGHWG